MISGQDMHGAGQMSMGVDIGSQMVKAVIVYQAGSRLEVRAAPSYSLEPGMVVDGVVKDTRRFARHFTSRLPEHHFRSAPTVVSIPSNLAVLRWVSLPPLDGDELRDAARFKVKRHLPFPVDSAYIEATVPDAADGDGMGQSLVIAVPKEIIDSRAEALEMAEVNLVGAELEAQAILRIVERKLSEQSALWRDASLTIIDVGANNTHMYVVQNQRLQFIRGLRFGSRRIANAVAAELQIDVDEADALIGHPDAELGRDGMISLKLGDLTARVSIQAETEKLTREFLRLLRYFRSLHPERSYAGILDHAVVCGGFVGIQGFAEYMEEALGLRIDRAKPFAGMLGTFSKETFDRIAGRQEAFTVVTGLALSGLKSPIKTIGDTSDRGEYAWARSA